MSESGGNRENKERKKEKVSSFGLGVVWNTGNFSIWEVEDSWIQRRLVIITHLTVSSPFLL